jgi:phage N-6-adenine-methyltransferase
MKTFAYETPWVFVKNLPEYPFDLDPCAEKETAKAKRFFTKEQDGLFQRWCGKVFCNPPYSEPEKWIRKALDERANCRVIVLLLKSDTGTKWFHDLLKPNAEIEFLRDRIRFNGERAPWPCLLARLR